MMLYSNCNAITLLGQGAGPPDKDHSCRSATLALVRHRHGYSLEVDSHL